MVSRMRLVCSACSREAPADRPASLCPCGKPFYVEYDLESIRNSWDRAVLNSRAPNLWRYREILPLDAGEEPVSLGEGMTPVILLERLGAGLGLSRLYLKDEAQNPTGTFKARGMSVAVSRARSLGIERFVIPSAGNAAGALAAYAARAGLQVLAVMPADTPRANPMECRIAGARVLLLEGTIADCGRVARVKAREEGWFDMSTLKEPYRVEGKKTMGYELAEQFAWRLPDVILYPTGGGTGLIGMWKAFREMEALGWIDGRRPRMVVVQAAGCAPLVEAFTRGLPAGVEIEHPRTVASGLRVPKALGDFIILDIVRRSGGTALAVTDEELLAAVAELNAEEGLFPCPEGAACWAACKRLAAAGWIRPEETVVLFNTGTGMKYLDVYARRLPGLGLSL